MILSIFGLIALNHIIGILVLVLIDEDNRLLEWAQAAPYAILSFMVPQFWSVLLGIYLYETKWKNR